MERFPVMLIPTRCQRPVLFALLLTMIAAFPVAAEPPAGVRWQDDLSVAWQATQEQQKPMLVMFTIADCPHCVRLKKLTFADPTVAADTDKFVTAIVNGGEPSALVEQLGIRFYPTVVVIGPNREVLDRLDGYIPAATMHTRLTAAARRATEDR